MVTNPSAAATDALIALSDEDAAVADRLLDVVNSPKNVEGLSRSAAGRKAKTDTDTAGRLLHLLVAARLVNYAGNGAWTRYHARRQ